MTTTEFDSARVNGEADDRDAPRRPRARRILLFWIAGAVLVLLLAAGAWLFSRIATVHRDVQQLSGLVDDLSGAGARADTAAMQASLDEMSKLTQEARDSASDPVWRVAEISPFFGGDLRAVREAVEVADDLVDVVGAPLVTLAGEVSPDSMFTDDGSLDISKLDVISATVSGVATDIVPIGERADAIQTKGLTGQVGEAVTQLKDQTNRAVTLVTDIDKATTIAGSMMGSDAPRTFLVLIMNNAELRAQGGMPGFTAAVEVSNGHLQLVQTASTTDYDPVPAAPLTETAAWEDTLFSSDVARRLQDVTATYDFRNTARYATALAEPVYGRTFDGVLAIDPYVLSYVMSATGPIALPDGTQLESGNAVNTLLRDVYIRYPEPANQDAFFAGAVDSLMGGISSGSFAPQPLLNAFSRSLDEDRIRLWSPREDEQAVIDTTEVDGVLPGAEDGATVGVYVNDWTRSKMDYYLDASTEVIDLGCTDGRHEAQIATTLTHRLTAEQAAALPAYVTGDGARVTKGDIGTQLVLVGPAGSQISQVTGTPTDSGLTTAVDGTGRPVDSRIVTVTPGQTATVTATIDWPDDGSTLTEVVKTPQVAGGDFTPTATGCR